MNEIQSNRCDRFVRKFFDIRAGAVAPTVAPEVGPVLAVEPEGRPENDFLLERRRFWQWVCLPAEIAKFATACLRNNSTDRLVIVEQIWWYYMGIGLLYVEMGNPTLPMLHVIGLPRALDDRYFNSLPAGRLYLATTATAIDPCAVLYSENPSMWPGAVLQPGGKLWLQAKDLNTEIELFVITAEREFDPGELGPWKW